MVLKVFKVTWGGKATRDLMDSRGGKAIWVPLAQVFKVIRVPKVFKDGKEFKVFKVLKVFKDSRDLKDGKEI